MKFNRAKYLLRKALKSQKSIQIDKLIEILNSLNISLDSLENEVKVIKKKNDIPTVIEFNGQRYIRDMQNNLNRYNFRK